MCLTEIHVKTHYGDDDCAGDGAVDDGAGDDGDGDVDSVYGDDYDDDDTHSCTDGGQDSWCFTGEYFDLRCQKVV